MGRVYLADDLAASQSDPDRKVAIKTVVDFDEWCDLRWSMGRPVDDSLYTDILTRFRRESMAWVRLGPHDNIIRAMWVFEVGTKPFLLMEYADSGDLQTWIAQRRLTLPLAVDFAIQFCEGMKYAVRTAGVVHRDIKPANALIKGNRLLKITDFGLSRAFDSPEHRDSADKGGVSPQPISFYGAGSPCYMPPEQFESLALADTRSDIFSFGAMLYELLTYSRLFERSTAYELALLGASLPAAHEINSQIPTELSAVVARCLNYDPAQRYPSFDAVAAGLSRVSQPITGRLLTSLSPYTIQSEPPALSSRLANEAFSLISLGQYEQAARCAQQGVDVDPENHVHWINKGKALVELKDFANARECFAQALHVSPDDPRSWANLGWAELELGKPTAGLIAAKRATLREAGFADGWLCRGSCEWDLGRHQQAISCVEVATELEPYNWKAHYQLGFFLAKLNREFEALASLTRAVEINPDDSSVWRLLALLYLQVGFHQEAREPLEKALKLAPNDAGTWALRARLEWEAHSDVAAAEVYLKKATELDPANGAAQLVRRMIEDRARHPLADLLVPLSEKSVVPTDYGRLAQTPPNTRHNASGIYAFSRNTVSQFDYTDSVLQRIVAALSPTRTSAISWHGDAPSLAAASLSREVRRLAGTLVGARSCATSNPLISPHTDFPDTVYLVGVWTDDNAALDILHAAFDGKRIEGYLGCMTPPQRFFNIWTWRQLVCEQLRLVRKIELLDGQVVSSA
jgi:serine/threonine protein kinase